MVFINEFIFIFIHKRLYFGRGSIAYLTSTVNRLVHSTNMRAFVFATYNSYVHTTFVVLH